MASSPTPPPRRQFGPFLSKQLKANASGIQWHDKEKGQFSFVWRDNRSRDKERNPLFKAWAEYNQRVIEGEEDWSQWKSTFKGALKNCPSIQHIEDIKNPSDKFIVTKVYEFVCLPEKKRKCTSANTGEKIGRCTNVTTASQPITDKSAFFSSVSASMCHGTELNIPSTVTEELKKGNNSVVQPLFEICTNTQLNALRTVQDLGLTVNCVQETDQSNHCYLQTQHHNVNSCEQRNIHIDKCGQTHQNYEQRTHFVHEVNNNCNIIDRSDPHTHPVSKQITQDTINPSDLVPDEDPDDIMNELFPVPGLFSESDSLSLTTDVPDFLNDAMVSLRVYYLNTLVLSTTLNRNDLGLHLFYDIKDKDHLSSSVIGPRQFKSVELPSADVLIQDPRIDLKMINKVKEVLDNTNRGVLLSCYCPGDPEGGKLNVRRLCTSKVYAWHICHGSLPLDRRCKMYQQLFDMNVFKKMVESYKQNPNPRKFPSPSTVLTFAEEFHPMEVMCVRVELTYVEADELLSKEMPNIEKQEFQYSDFDSGDLFLQQFRQSLSLSPQLPMLASIENPDNVCWDRLSGF